MCWLTSSDDGTRLPGKRTGAGGKGAEAHTGSCGMHSDNKALQNQHAEFTSASGLAHQAQPLHF